MCVYVKGFLFQQAFLSGRNVMPDYILLLPSAESLPVFFSLTSVMAIFPIGWLCNITIQLTCSLSVQKAVSCLGIFKAHLLLLYGNYNLNKYFAHQYFGDDR